MKNLAHLFGINPPAVMKTKYTAEGCAFPELIMGVELEIENIGNFDLALDQRGANWNVVEDGSLRPLHQSWEFVSSPLTMGAMVAELKEFFNRWPALTKERNYSDRTSVHVHTNVSDFNSEQLLTLALTYSVVEDTLFEFVNHYHADSEDGYSRDSNIYCIPWTQCRMNVEFAKKFLNDPYRVLKNWQKYTALNLVPITSKGSVEWRHMHGTNDVEKLVKWLNIIGSIMRFSKTVDHADVVQTIKQLNDTSAYRQFFTQIFQSYLEYDEKYAQPMASGVVTAKLSLMKAGGAADRVVFDELNILEGPEDLDFEIEERARVQQVARDAELRRQREGLAQAQPAPQHDPFAHWAALAADQALAARLWARHDEVQGAPAAAAGVQARPAQPARNEAARARGPIIRNRVR